MRKFCLLICISLFSSMFHAVAMPVKTGQAPAAEVAATKTSVTAKLAESFYESNVGIQRSVYE